MRAGGWVPISVATDRTIPVSSGWVRSSTSKPLTESAPVRRSTKSVPLTMAITTATLGTRMAPMARCVVAMNTTLPMTTAATIPAART